MVSCRLLYATVVITFGSSFQFGYQTGVINAPIQLLEDFIANVTLSRGKTPTKDFVATMSSLIVAGFPIGGILGAILGSSMSNMMGRKLALFILNVPMAAGSLLMMGSKLAYTFEMIIIGRIIVGVACGAFTGIAPVYLAEIAPINSRGASGITNQLAIVTAILLSQVFGLPQAMGTQEMWPYLLGLSIIPSVILLILLWTFPDSPRHLLLNRLNEDSARYALEFYRKKGSDIDAEIEEMLQENVNIIEIQFSLRELFKSPPLRVALLISIVAHLSQQFSGINAALFYSTALFVSIGIGEANAVYATLGVGCMIVVVTVASIFLIERFGRRTLLLSGLTVMLISAVFITVGLTTRTLNANVVYMAIAFIYIFVAGFAIGPGSIPWFIVAEMFVQETRDGAILITVLINWISQAVISLGYPQILSYLGDYSFVPFIGFLTIFICLLFRYLPETKGRTPRDVQMGFFGQSENPTHSELESVSEEPAKRSELSEPFLGNREFFHPCFAKHLSFPKLVVLHAAVVNVFAYIKRPRTISEPDSKTNAPVSL